MHHLITGGTGFIGSALLASLRADGDTALVLTRHARPPEDGVAYVTDLRNIAVDSHFDAVINLAGASLAGARWTPAYKREIVDSRLGTTRALGDLLGRLERPPAVLLSASAVGYYGHQGDTALHEDSPVVSGFAQELCRQWEEAAVAAAAGRTRVCLLRFGVVLDRSGGALVDMARPFRFGVANWIGRGDQWLSWVHRRDVVAAVRFLLTRPELSGPFNITAPEPVTSRGFCTAMKRHFTTFITAPVPGPVLRLAVGEMAEELLLHGQRVLPTRLQSAGFRFSLPELADALGAVYDS